MAPDPVWPAPPARLLKGREGLVRIEKCRSIPDREVHRGSLAVGAVDRRREVFIAGRTKESCGKALRAGGYIVVVEVKGVRPAIQVTVRKGLTDESRADETIVRIRREHRRARGQRVICLRANAEHQRSSYRRSATGAHRRQLDDYTVIVRDTIDSGQHVHRILHLARQRNGRLRATRAGRAAEVIPIGRGSQSNTCHSPHQTVPAR